MSYSIEKLPGEPVILTIMGEDFSMEEHEEFLGELIALFDSQPEPVYLIADVENYTFSLQDLLIAVNKAARGGAAILHHPNLAGTLTVSTSKLMRLSAKGVKSDTFGNVHAEIFNTVEEALTYVRTITQHGINAA